ncbi:hypothetical protein [Mesorhizobium amorphae]|uniref:hypothetical protein n=1 Tax=Mesorhizobium amorphae TaxID=71433 RepID=UPI001FEF85FC|nr:hypothetical protein [Mesorhizobium amorphae]
MVGSAILAFAPSFDETMITILLTGHASTLPVRLWAITRLGFSPDINALVVLIPTFIVLLCVLVARFGLPAKSQLSEPERLSNFTEARPMGRNRRPALD